MSKSSHSPEPFDLLRSPLTGANLLEASAGTGKTYTIAGLFIRLVLEENIEVHRILVVTFTEAATEELKGRIRSRLAEALAAFEGDPADDPFLTGLVEKCGQKGDGSTVSTEDCVRRIREALQGFDEAAIFTIHGFCKRMLHECAFESGSLFDTELVTDQSSLIEEIVKDFWRIHFYDASPLFVDYVLSKTSPSGLISLVNQTLAHADIRIIPEIDRPDTAAAETAYQEAFEAAAACWEKERTAVKTLLMEDKGLHRTSYSKKSIPDWIETLNAFFSLDHTQTDLCAKFEKFTTSGLNESKSLRKGQTPPSHPFFELCEDLQAKHQARADAFRRYLLALEIELFGYVRQEMKKRKAASNIQSFDDLLNNLRNALRGEGGEALAERIRERYRAALIDEFQDTDPVQYDIFKTVFHTPGHVLFLIGDPKQAIYGFRGADVFAYMGAKQDPDAAYTLGYNWRSQADLIQAVNAVFEGHPRAFVYEEIPFSPVQAPEDRPDQESLRIDKKTEPPLQVWMVEAENFGQTESERKKALAKGTAVDVILDAVAAEISNLLDLGRRDRATLGDRPVMPGDIAVLVRTNREAGQLRDTLFPLGIPSGIHSTGDIFDTREAGEMERVLAGIAQPRSEAAIRSALATDILGVSGDELDALTQDENAWEEWPARFGDYHHLWNIRGFIRMFRLFLSREAVLERLMALADGERRCTNLLQLGEILHRMDVERKIGMAGLIKWLTEQMNQSDRREEEHPLRLENDENAVKLVTVHKSKGLEYPIVFCPLMWTTRDPDKGQPALFHDEAADRRVTFDLGSDQFDRHLGFLKKEMLAENLRLLYVALTRARNRCYFVWGRINKAEHSAPAYLFHGSDIDAAADIVSETGDRFSKLTDADVKIALERVRDHAPGCMAVTPLPKANGIPYSPYAEKTPELHPRRFSAHIPRDFRISSFSSLVSGRRLSPELADYDAFPLKPETAADSGLEPVFPIDRDAETIFTFPRGAKAGNCLHKILEEVDFKSPADAAARDVIQRNLRRYGFKEKWTEVVREMVSKVVNTPLTDEKKGPVLSRIPMADRINEMAFYFPLRRISADGLRRVFEAHGGPGFPSTFPKQIGRLDFSPVKGFMKGFIDLIFRYRGRYYLVDWKSNFLGDTVEHYRAEQLSRTIAEAFYLLQYHIYTLALHQYLTLRDPNYRYEDHFGGVFYLFLRGMDPKQGPDYGVFRDRPEKDLVEALRTFLIAGA
jgi:exodeoxyribonuclease V beta subunit